MLRRSPATATWPRLRSFAGPVPVCGVDGDGDVGRFDGGLGPDLNLGTECAHVL